MSAFPNVHFQPWVRKGYCSSNPRILILGESHHSNDYPEMTVEVINDHLSGRQPNIFFDRIASLVTDQPIGQADAACCFDRVAFYNFVQKGMLPDAGKKPTRADFKDSMPAFRTILERLAPQKIVALGWRSHDGIPDDWTDDGTSAWRWVRRKTNQLELSIGAFLVEDLEFPTVFMMHPSAPGFDLNLWRPQVSKFLSMA